MRSVGTLAVVPALCVAGLIGPAAAAEIGTRARVELAAGHDTNPLRVAGDGPNSGFADLGLAAALDAKLGRARVTVGLDALARVHGADRSEADTERAELRLTAELPPLDVAGRRLDLALGVHHGIRRSVYTDRRTGELYLVAASDDPSAGVPVGSRLDSDTSGLFADARWRLARRVMLTLDAELSAADFTNDYGGVTTLDPLDSTSLSLEPGIRWRVAGPVLVGASLVLARTDYGDRPALDAAGAEVPGTSRRYDHVQRRLVVQVAPSEQWRARVGIDHARRSDAHAGFFDSAGTGVWASLEQRLGDRATLTVYGTRRSLDYEHLTVDSGELRLSDESRLLGRLTYRVTPALDWFVESGVDRADSTDPDYAHHRDWVRSGIAFEH